MRELLSTAVESGTGRGAVLPIPTFGKTGTTQDNRDALFIGYAGDVVTGVWLGNDDNSPNPGLSGSGLPARIWRDFMTRALDLRIPPPEPTTEPDNFTIDLEDVVNGVGGFFDDSGIRTEIIRPRPEEMPLGPEDEEPPFDDRFFSDRRPPDRRDDRR